MSLELSIIKCPTTADESKSDMTTLTSNNLQIAVTLLTVPVATNSLLLLGDSVGAYIQYPVSAGLTN